MKAKNHFLTTLLFFSIGYILYGQSGMKIQPGGAVTVTGNTIIANGCGQPVTDPRDSKTYNTVLIGNQCWFAQNLNVGAKILGSAGQTNNSIIEKYCYNNDDANCAIYGGLYQWDEAMQYSTIEGVQGICPAGWHLPTDAEWTSLTTFLGGETVAGGKMKEVGYTHWGSTNTGATNSSGFTALPGGYRGNSGGFGGQVTFGFFLSSTQYDATNVWNRFAISIDESLNRSSYSMTEGFSVRCLKD